MFLRLFSSILFWSPKVSNGQNPTNYKTHKSLQPPETKEIWASRKKIYTDKCSLISNSKISDQKRIRPQLSSQNAEFTYISIQTLKRSPELNFLTLYTQFNSLAHASVFFRYYPSKQLSVCTWNKNLCPLEMALDFHRKEGWSEHLRCRCLHLARWVSIHTAIEMRAKPLHNSIKIFLNNKIISFHYTRGLLSSFCTAWVGQPPTVTAGFLSNSVFFKPYLTWVKSFFCCFFFWGGDVAVFLVNLFFGSCFVIFGWLVGFGFILIWPSRAETGISTVRQRNAGLEH